MEQFLNFCKSEYFNLAILIINIILMIIFIISIISINKTKKIYKTLIRKMGKSGNIEDLLFEVMEKVKLIEEENKEIKLNCSNLNKEISTCIKKVGIVRYSAFKDMGSDLSFALALLDEFNNGVILNGIYSVENSNIYAKPVENGSSKYTLSEEEEKALDIAMQR